MNPVLRWMGGRLATYLAQPIRGAQSATASLEQLGAALKPGDVLLVEGNTRVSVAIKYLNQSTWSHAMFYIGDALGPSALGESPRVLVEADMLYGIRAVPLSDVSGMNTRICRAVGLSKEDLQAVIRFTVSHIGGRYDLKNVFDLARHLLDAGRPGLPVGALPDPARGQVRPRRDARLQRLLSRSHAHPASQLVHAARLRHLALLRGGEAHHRQGLRLSQDSLGPGRPGLTGERAAMPKYETKLSASETVAEGTMAFHFARPADFKFQAGQSMNVALIDPPETDHKGNLRAFSRVSAPYETELVIATRIRDTAFKRSLKAMPAGGRIHLRGPAGNFTLDRADARPAVFLAGGIGVTPFMSMSRQAAHDRLARDIWLFYSNRRPEDAAFLEELAALPRRNPRYRFVGTMGEMAKSSRPWSGETGVLDRAVLERR